MYLSSLSEAVVNKAEVLHMRLSTVYSGKINLKYNLSFSINHKLHLF